MGKMISVQSIAVAVAAHRDGPQPSESLAVPLHHQAPALLLDVRTMVVISMLFAYAFPQLVPRA
jgi:L-lactate permease